MTTRKRNIRKKGGPSSQKNQAPVAPDNPPTAATAPVNESIEPPLVAHTENISPSSEGDNMQNIIGLSGLASSQLPNPNPAKTPTISLTEWIGLDSPRNKRPLAQELEFASETPDPSHVPAVATLGLQQGTGPMIHGLTMGIDNKQPPNYRGPFQPCRDFISPLNSGQNTETDQSDSVIDATINYIWLSHQQENENDNDYRHQLHAGL